MTDALTIFGKPLSSGHHGHVRHGILKLSINGEYGPGWTTEWRASVSIAGETLSESETMHYNAQACSWLESEARRIMRECFEIAGPMTACRWGEDGLPVQFDDKCGGAMRKAKR